jgi:hypothetical protein
MRDIIRITISHPKEMGGFLRNLNSFLLRMANVFKFKILDIKKEEVKDERRN